MLTTLMNSAHLRETSLIRSAVLIAITFGALLFATAGAGQEGQADPDGDGLVGAADDDPLIANVPRIVFIPQGVKYGIRQEVAQTGTVTTESVDTESTALTRSEQKSRSDKRTETLKQTTAAKISASLSVKNVVSGGIGANLDYTSTSETSDVRELSSSEKDAFERERTSKASTIRQMVEITTAGPASGFIGSGATILNLGPEPVTVKSVSASIVSVALDDPSDIQVIQNGCFRTDNASLGGAVRSAVDPSKPPPPPPNGTPATTPPSVASPAIARGAAANIDCGTEADYKATLSPERQPSPPERRALYFEGLSAGAILGLLEQRRYLKLEIPRWTIMRGAQPIDYFDLVRRVESKTVFVRIIDQAGREHTKYVSVAASGGSGAISLADALKHVGLGPIETAIVDGSPVLARIGKTRSDFTSWSNPAEFNDNELNQGTWAVINNSDVFDGNINDPAPPGSRFAVVYLTKRDLKDSLRTITSYSRTVRSTSAVGQVPATDNTQCFASVKTGDVLNFRFRSYVEEPAPRDVALDGTDQASVDAVEKEIGAKIHWRGRLKGWGMGVVLPRYSERMIWRPQNNAYGIRIGFGQDWSTQPLAETPGIIFEPNETSRWVRASMTVSAKQLTDGVGNLCLSPEATEAKIRIGRYGSIPREHGDLQSAISAGGARKWVEADPVSDHSFIQGRRIEVEGELIRSAPAPQ